MANRTEELASKTLGATKTAKATLEGLTGIFKKLAQEHGEVSALLMRVNQSSDVDVRRKLFPKIRAELLAHEQGELRQVYPVFRRYSETQKLAEQHDQEAVKLHQSLAQLAGMDIASDDWKSEFAHMVEMVQQHVKEEENEFFPAGQRTFGERTSEMLTAYERTKEQVLRELTELPQA